MLKPFLIKRTPYLRISVFGTKFKKGVRLMSIDNFITTILNLNDSEIESIVNQSVDNEVLINIKLKVKEKDLLCPYCHNKRIIHSYHKRIIKHAALNNRNCNIIYYQRRLKCKRCNSTSNESNPFSFSNENLSYETKINILKDLKYVGSTYSAVAKKNNVSVQTVINLFDKCVDIKRKPLPEVLSIDEHYFPSSNIKDSAYVCILMNFLTGEIIDILPDRKKKVLIDYFYKIRKETLSEDGLHSELDNVKYVSIDMYEPYRDVVKTLFPKAIICADEFHVDENLLRIFRHIKNECKRSCKDNSINYLFNKFRFIFDHNLNLDNEAKYNKVFKRYLSLRDIQTIIFNEFDYLKKAYELKELYLDFNDLYSFDTAEKRLNELIDIFSNSGIIEYDEFVITLKNWKKEIINSFIVIYGSRINNSYIESMNHNIQRLMYNANGFINFKRTRNRFLYCLNKNDTYKLK